MNAIETIKRIGLTNLIKANCKYCLVNSFKIPFKLNGEKARPNEALDFVSFEDLVNADTNSLVNYAGIGISVKASNLCAIDIDKCFSIPFDFSSGDERAKDVYEKFKDIAYIEFSFSGKGLRILFRHPNIDNYSDKYYTKNSKINIEYYQPINGARYVTVTGVCLANNDISEKKEFWDTLNDFLNKYMLKPKTSLQDNKMPTSCDNNDDVSLDILFKKIKKEVFCNLEFQDNWFKEAPGSNSNESERDFYLISYIYHHVTTNKEKVRILFESSPFFKSKDRKHLYKWNYNNYRYFNYMWERLN